MQVQLKISYLNRVTCFLCVATVDFFSIELYMMLRFLLSRPFKDHDMYTTQFQLGVHIYQGANEQNVRKRVSIVVVLSIQSSILIDNMASEETLLLQSWTRTVSPCVRKS